MTKQSTPTPLEELVAMRLTSEFFIASDGHGSVGIRTDEEAAAIVIAAGWKSPAEVAKLVQAAAAKAWNVGVADGINCMASPSTSGFLVNPYIESAPDTTEESNV